MKLKHSAADGLKPNLTLFDDWNEEENVRNCSSTRLCLMLSRSPPWRRWGSRRGEDLTRCVGPQRDTQPGDEDRSARVRRRRWRGAPWPPQQGGQDEEAAVAQAQPERGRPHRHGAWSVADQLPAAGHGRTVWGERLHRLPGPVVYISWSSHHAIVLAS